MCDVAVSYAPSPSPLSPLKVCPPTCGAWVPGGLRGLGASPRGWVVGGTFNGAPATLPALPRPASRTLLWLALFLLGVCVGAVKGWEGSLAGRVGKAWRVATNGARVCRHNLLPHPAPRTHFRPLPVRSTESWGLVLHSSASALFSPKLWLGASCRTSLDPRPAPRRRRPAPGRRRRPRLTHHDPRRLRRLRRRNLVSNLHRPYNFILDLSIHSRSIFRMPSEFPAHISTYRQPRRTTRSFSFITRGAIRLFLTR